MLNLLPIRVIASSLLLLLAWLLQKQVLLAFLPYVKYDGDDVSLLTEILKRDLSRKQSNQIIIKKMITRCLREPAPVAMTILKF